MSDLRKRMRNLSKHDSVRHGAWQAEVKRLQEDIDRLQLQSSNISAAAETSREEERTLAPQSSPLRPAFVDMSANVPPKHQNDEVATGIQAAKTPQVQLDSATLPTSRRPGDGREAATLGRASGATERVSQTTAEKPQLSPWEICYQVNLAFQKKIIGLWQCVACNRTGTAATPEYRSNFVMEVAICPDGHRDHLSSFNAERKMITCNRCDEDFALRLSQETIKCFNAKCRRMLVVDGELVRWMRSDEEWQETHKQ
jgi:hypothetical protein